MTQGAPHHDGRGASDATGGSRLLGVLLMTAGGLVASLCGLCTLVVIIGIGSAGQAAAVLGPLALIPLILGGAPALAGAVCFMFGLKVFRDGAKTGGPSDSDRRS